MPNIVLKLPRDCFTRNQIDQIASKVTNAVHTSEGIPDDPKHHLLSWLSVEEIDAQHLYIGGKSVCPNILPIVVVLFQPEGVLDEERRTQQAANIDREIRSVIGPAEQRVQVSCIMLEVPDGQWSGNGAILRLPQIASIAGFQHLSHLAEPA